MFKSPKTTDWITPTHNSIAKKQNKIPNITIPSQKFLNNIFEPTNPNKLKITCPIDIFITKRKVNVNGRTIAFTRSAKLKGIAKAKGVPKNT